MADLKTCGCCGETFSGRNGKYCSRKCANSQFYKHGETLNGKMTPEFKSWASMIHRCTNTHTPDYVYYGARGITICERWLKSYENFLADMGRRPSPKHSLDRIDNDGNYEPGNVRWATRTQQVRNTRNAVKISEPDGTRSPLADVAEKLGLKYATALYRYHKGIPLDRKLWSKS